MGTASRNCMVTSELEGKGVIQKEDVAMSYLCTRKWRSNELHKRITQAKSKITTKHPWA